MHVVLTNLKNLRKHKGYSQEIMGLEMGLDESAYKRLEKGTNTIIDLERLEKAAEVLEIDIIGLMCAHRYRHIETVFKLYAIPSTASNALEAEQDSYGTNSVLELQKQLKAVNAATETLVELVRKSHLLAGKLPYPDTEK
ncbi:MAG: helix-turn-helix transcriptional regulator [Bacteroidota bacterium]